MSHRRVAVIGGGVSGLAAARWLAEEGLESVVFERSARVGGVWVLHQDVFGGGPAYHSLRTNTSRQVTSFSDFALPANLPDFPHRSEIVSYLERYVEFFKLRQRIRFQTNVEQVSPKRAGGWVVKARSREGEQSEEFEAVIVATGINWHPVTPQFSGLETYPGRVMHSMSYVESEPFRGEEVLVVGVGSSAADIAPEIATVARSVALSTRSGALVVPRYLDGRPFDHWNTRLFQSLPPRVQNAQRQSRLLRAYRLLGLTSLTDIWKPVELDAARGKTVTSDQLLRFMMTGDIHIRPNIERIRGPEVCFVDGTRGRPTTIVFCTGYTRAFPFLADLVSVAPDSSIDLYKHVFQPDMPMLAFIGMCRVQGSVLPIAELQARWVARVMCGKTRLPTSGQMWSDIAARRRRQVMRQTAPMRVSFLAYADEIAREVGAQPRLWRHPRLLRPLLVGPPVAAQFRLDGPARTAAR